MKQNTGCFRQRSFVRKQGAFVSCATLLYVISCVFFAAEPFYPETKRRCSGARHLCFWQHSFFSRQNTSSVRPDNSSMRAKQENRLPVLQNNHWLHRKATSQGWMFRFNTCACSKIKQQGSNLNNQGATGRMAWSTMLDDERNLRARLPNSHRKSHNGSG